MSDYQDAPDGATLLTKVVVGQELHGLTAPDPHAAYHGVFIHDTERLLSPWSNVNDVHVDINSRSYIAYELREFIRRAASGDPEALQLLYSDKIAFDTWAFNMLRKHRVLLLDSDAIYNSYVGYALKKIELLDGLKPFKVTGLFAAEVICTILQGTELLGWGYMTTDMKGYPFELHEKIQRVRYQPTLTGDEFTELVTKYRKLLDTAYNDKGSAFTVDTVWLDDFVNDIYVNQHGLTTRVRNGYPN